MYAAETTTEITMGTVLLTLWSTVFALTLICPELMKPSVMGPSSVFYLFSGISFIATLFCYCYIIETFGLTDKEKKEIFMTEDQKRKVNERMEIVEAHTPTEEYTLK